MQQLSIARKGALLIVLPIVTQMTFGIALLVVVREAVEAHARELHSQNVLEKAHDARFALTRAQSALRAFVATGTPSFRTSCDEAGRAGAQNLRLLSKLVADNPLQLRRVAEMTRTADDFIAFQEANARLVESGRRDEAASNVATHRGDRLMAAFLTAMNGFLDEEKQLAEARHARGGSANHTMNVVVVASLMLSLAVAGVMAYTMSNGIKRRLDVLTENARRLATDQALLAPLSEGDEIAAVDRGFHAMAESLARAIEDLQRANREMEAFSYSVSHDLRTPLRAIDGFSRILEEEYGVELDAEGKRILGVIRHSTVTMAALIDDLLSFSRLSRQPIARTGVDMTALARQAYSDTRHDAGEREIEFVLHDLPPASGDLTMLRQVFTNLLSNAVKFTRPRDAARIEVGAADSVYYVKDNGVGFDPRYADKLFGVFQRLHAPHDFEGTGVGLAIVQRVVQRHGGRVWAESVSGSGSTFYFTLG